MVLYRRNRVAGGTYFFTVTLRDRNSDLLIKHIPDLRNAFRQTRKSRPFDIDAVVVLPEHLHAIFTLPNGDDDYPSRWKSIKARFTRALAKKGVLSPAANGEYTLWQRRYWEHTIRDEEDMARHVDYIHFNPVKHGLVTRVDEWPYSSFHRYIENRMVDKDWAGCAEENSGAFGE